MPSKTFFASKINWLGIITVLAGLSQFVGVLPDNIGKYVATVSGIAMVILRTYGTSEPIASKPDITLGGGK